MLALRESLLGPEHLDVSRTRNNLGIVLSDQGKYEEAEATHRQALAAKMSSLGPAHPDVATSRNNLAAVLSDRGAPDRPTGPPGA